MEQSDEQRSLRSRPNLATASSSDCAIAAEPADDTRGRGALFGTCSGQRNEPRLGEDLIAIFEHNGIPVELEPEERCCAPRLELGDLEGMRRRKHANIPMLAALVDQGCDLMAPVPSCVHMFKQELPMLFEDDLDVKRVAAAMHDPSGTSWSGTARAGCAQTGCASRDTSPPTIADEDLPRENEEKTSSVHILRFELAPSMMASLEQRAALAIGVDHDNYNASVDPVSEQTRTALLADLD